jgi:hypothetical protein
MQPVDTDVDELDIALDEIETKPLEERAVGYRALHERLTTALEGEDR